MTSMFDQYEQASQRAAIPAIVTPEVPSSGYVSMRLEEDAPIFSKQRMQFNPTDNITHLAAANDLLVLAMANNTLFRIDLRQPDKAEEIPLNKPTSRVSGLFLDPLGQHLLIALTPRVLPDNSYELWYLPRRSPKPKAASRFRGNDITAVGWNQENSSETCTGHILLGTAKGLIYETEIGIEGDNIFSSNLEQYWRQVFDIGKGSVTPITGLEFFRLSSGRLLVLVTTPNRLYQFSGQAGVEERGALLQGVFNAYLNVPEGFIEMPSSLKYSRLRVRCEKERGVTVPKTIAWLVEPGLYYAQIDSTSPDTSDFIINSQLLPFPSSTLGSGDKPSPSSAPLSVTLTEFHALLLYTDRVQGISLLNGQSVFSETLNESLGRLVGLVRDPVRGTVWAFTDKAVFRYKVTREDRDVWRILADKHEFERAKYYCGDNPAHLDKVLVKQAEVLFEAGKFSESASIYAQTQCSFESVCLRFLQGGQSGQMDALQQFLSKKLQRLQPQDKTQITMLVVWVVDLFLSQIGNLRIRGQLDGPECTTLQGDLERFLSQPLVAECVRSNKGALYHLAASHGDAQNLLGMTLANRDFEAVIAEHVLRGRFAEALQVLQSQGKVEPFYRHAPLLMEALPGPTVSALIAQGRRLDPARLLPALVCGLREDKEGTSAAEAMRYLEYLVHSAGCTERAVHNLLVTLYTKHRPNKLMQYLATQGIDVACVHYDAHYVLRLCRELGLTEACVQLSALLGLWEAAVDLALEVSLDLAKATAAQPQHDTELRKKLWLKIAKHVVEGKDDVQQAMEFLHQCDLIRIEDLLPFFSDFVTIDHFKDAICSSLQEYNQHIQELRDEMQEATRSAQRVHESISSWKARSVQVSVQHSCELCNVTLMLRPFCLFPCGHKFHSDCLQQHLSKSKLNRLSELQKQLVSLPTKSDSGSRASTGPTQQEQVRADMDELIASECLLCGETMIRSIDLPFIADKEWENIARDWE